MTDRDRKFKKTRNFGWWNIYKICVEWAYDHFGHHLTKIDSLLTKTCTKNYFYIFVSSDFDLWPLDSNHSPSVRSFYSFPISRNWRHGNGWTGRRTDRRTVCNTYYSLL